MTTMKTFLAVKNEGTVPQIFIQGFIGSSWFFEGNTDKGIKNILDSLGDQEEIEVVINGLAASAASIIAMAGDTIKIYNNAQLMIHRASTYGEGNVDDFRTIADQLESIDKSVKASYKTRFNGTDEALQELLEKESFMDAETALSYGLVDEIIDAENSSGTEAKKEQSVEEILNEVEEKRAEKIAAFTAALNKTFGQGDAK
ncbi:Clp protease ClpP [Enterococcus faecium]|nr:Clp protease ClpP [Enterococcus faecium]